MKFYIYTLGCKVNAYESKVMYDCLINSGYKEGLRDDCDICIINTCTVTNSADSKSLKTIKQAIKKNPKAIIVVVGCLPQTNKEKVLQIPGVDIVLGNINKSKIAEYIKEYSSKIDDVKDISNVEFESMKLNNFNKTRAFVKIQDGCNNYCSYCIIPYSRGNIRSKNKDDVINEVKNLIKNNHKEIVLTGIHTGSYYDFDNNYSFSDLLKDLVKIKGLERLRISSIEINEINDEVLDIIRNNEVLVDHMHIPLQSGSDKILRLMNRKYNKNEFIDRIAKIREVRPNISITTDVIVGFPNETEKFFEESVSTIKQIGFSKIHVFPYSIRKNTKASLMDNQVDDKVKKQRVKYLLDLSKQLEIDYMNKFINSKVWFIPEVYKDGYLIGHTGNYLLVKVKGNKDLLNQNVCVLLKEVLYPYCIGVL